MSEMRKRYFRKLAGRCVVFTLCAVACVVAPERFMVSLTGRFKLKK